MVGKERGVLLGYILGLERLAKLLTQGVYFLFIILLLFNKLVNLFSHNFHAYKTGICK